MIHAPYWQPQFPFIQGPYRFHISSNDLTQFFGVDYFPVAELNHLKKTETGGHSVACITGMQVPSLGGSVIKDK
jgi:hypothetical protein